MALSVVYGVGAEIAFNASGGAADWIMLMPIAAGGLVTTVDGRGPYRVADPAKLIADSLAAHAGRIPIDETHSTDLAAPEGRPAPARGWVTKLDARADGIYGHVEWSPSGSQLMGERAYRFISPVIVHDQAGNVLDLPRASLTNTPNLRGMAALHATETDEMDLITQLRTALGLDATADADAVLTKVKGLCGTDTAMQSVGKALGLTAITGETVIAGVNKLKAGLSLASIAKAAGLKEDADETAIVTAITSLAAAGKSGDGKTVVALQTEVKELGERLQTALQATAKDKATAFIDGEIAKGRVGVKASRDHYIARHSANAEGAAAVEKEIGGMPIVHPGQLMPMTPPASTDSLTANPVALAAAATKHQKALADQGVIIDYATAVNAVAAQGAK